MTSNDWTERSWCIVNDEDGVLYVVPHDLKNLWYEWAKHAGQYALLPDYAVEIGRSPSRVLFQDFKIEDDD